MKTLITGGAGFIGFHVASRLMALKHEVAILDNFNDFYDPRLKRRNIQDLQKLGPVSIHEIDILDPGKLRRAFEEIEPQTVIHLAAWAGVRPSLLKPALYSDVNITGTVHLLDLACEFKVGSFLFGSSSSVYGGSSRVPFREDDPVDKPVSPYAATKRAGELLCHTYSHNRGLNVTCLRFFTVYGPRQRPEMAIHKFSRLILDGGEIPIFGDGTSRRDYTYIDDIVSGVLAAARVNPRFEILNLGESETIGLLELVALLEEALGKKAHLVFLPEQPGDMAVTFADISRSRRVLGYAPETPIRDGIKKFARWLLKGDRLPCPPLGTR